MKPLHFLAISLLLLCAASPPRPAKPAEVSYPLRLIRGKVYDFRAISIL